MTRNKTMLITLVALAGVLYGYWHFLLAPKRAEAAQLSTEIATKEASVAQAEATVAQYVRLKDSYKGNYETLLRIGKAVPGDDDVRSLLVQIASTARRSGVDFRKISTGESGDAASQPTVSGATDSSVPPGATPLAGGVSQMPFSFTFTGRFGRLGGFLSRLERYVTLQEKRVAVTGRLLRVDSLSLAPGGAGYPTLQADVDASTYLAAPPKAPAAGTAAGTSTPASSSGGGTTPTTTATVPGALR